MSFDQSQFTPILVSDRNSQMIFKANKPVVEVPDQCYAKNGSTCC